MQIKLNESKKDKITYCWKVCVHIVGQHAFNYAQIFSTTGIKRPTSRISKMVKDALLRLNAIIGEILKKLEE